MSNFSFSRNVFKRLVLQTCKNQGLFGKGLNGALCRYQHYFSHHHGDSHRHLCYDELCHLRVSDHVEMYMNHIDLRKITYRFMFQYAQECKNKRAMMALDYSPESFSPQMNSTSLFLWFKLVIPGVGPVLIARGII